MAQDERLFVNIVSEDLARRARAQISSFINVKVIVALIVRRLGFPVFVESGKPLYYYLIHQQTQRRLRYYESLPMAGVASGDTLIVCSVAKDRAEMSPEMVDVSVLQAIEAGEEVIVFDEEGEFTQEDAGGTVVTKGAEEEKPVTWIGSGETPWRRAGPFRCPCRRIL